MSQEVNELLESYQSYITRVPNGCSYIVDSLRVNNLQEALTSIKDFSEGVMWLLDASTILKEHSVETNFNVMPLLEFLEEINEGLTNGDYLLVADIFEYEIIPFFENFLKG